MKKMAGTPALMMSIIIMADAVIFPLRLVLITLRQVLLFAGLPARGPLKLIAICRPV